MLRRTRVEGNRHRPAYNPAPLVPSESASALAGRGDHRLKEDRSRRLSSASARRLHQLSNRKQGIRLHRRKSYNQRTAYSQTAEGIGSIVSPVAWEGPTEFDYRSVPPAQQSSCRLAR